MEKSKVAAIIVIGILGVVSFLTLIGPFIAMMSIMEILDD